MRANGKPSRCSIYPPDGVFFERAISPAAPIERARFTIYRAATVRRLMAFYASGEVLRFLVLKDKAIVGSFTGHVSSAQQTLIKGPRPVQGVFTVHVVRVFAGERYETP